MQQQRLDGGGVEDASTSNPPPPSPRSNKPSSCRGESMQQPHEQRLHQHYPYHHTSTSDVSSSTAHQSEAYRGAAQGSSLEGQTAMQQQPQHPMNGAQMHQPSYLHATQYHYPPNGVMQPQPMPSNEQPLMRYPIPPQTPLDSRQMTGARGKKEIKRRTKTGCLTCRKRRIKCDEGQPTCRNCAKSKRECLGYDPIFKQQTGPAPIQPAPASAATPASKAVTTPTLPSNPYSAQSYPPAGGAFVPAAAIDVPYEYHTSLDPALGSGEQIAMAQNSYGSNLQPERRVKHIVIDDLFALNDVPPQYQKREAPPPLTQAIQQEVADFYGFHFAGGLDRLFETNWYSTQGLATLQTNSTLHDFVAQCADSFKSTDNSPTERARIRSLEARLLWHLAAMPRSVATQTALQARVDIVENLLTGQFLDPNRIPHAPAPEQHSGTAYNELSFWHHLGRFAAARDDRDDLTVMRQVGEILNAMRAILGMVENRDVLYSMAIVRHFGGRLAEFHPQRRLVASNNDENDPVNKVKVAHQFVELEDQKASTQVMQRICSMALRGWSLQKQ